MNVCSLLSISVANTLCRQHKLVIYCCLKHLTSCLCLSACYFSEAYFSEAQFSV